MVVRSRATSILAAVFALAALPLLSYGAPAAESAPLQAFPAIAGAASSQTAASQAPVVALPSGIQSGERLLALVAGAETSLFSVTERFDQGTTAGNTGALGIATGLKPLAGAFGATTLSVGAGRAGFQIALEPAAPSVGIGYVGAGTPAGGTGSIVPTLPALWLQGDVFFLFVETDDEAVATPAGWTAVSVIPRWGGSTRLTTFWRRATAGESDPTVAPSFLWNHGFAVILAFRGVKQTGNPWNVLGAATTGTSLPGATTTVDNCLVIAAVSTSGLNAFSSWANAGGFGSAPTGWTQLAQVAGSFNTSALYTRIANGSEGATVTMPWTYGNATKHWSARITGADPAASAIVTSTATSTTMTPDPPRKSPAWGAADTLWIAWLGKRASGTATDYPDAHTNYQFTQGYAPASGPGAAIAVAARQFTAGSQDPNTFTIPDGQNSSYGTLAIKPIVTPPPPPLGALPLDDFNRPNEDPLSQGGAWASTPLGGSGITLEVISNQAAQNETTGFAASYRNADLSGDAEVYATVSVAPGNNEYMDLYLHLQQPALPTVAGYRARWRHWTGTDSITIQRFDSSGTTNLVAANLEPLAGDTLLLRRIGEGLELWRKTGGSWAQLASTVDTTYWSGKLGLGSITNHGFWDDFGGGEVGSESSSWILLDQYAPELRFWGEGGNEETYRADSAAIATDLFLEEPQDHSVVLKCCWGNESATVASADPNSPLPDLSLDYLSATQPTPDYYLAQPKIYPDDILGAAIDYLAWVDMHPEQRGVIYGRVKSDPGSGDKILQYWMFYYYNPKNVAGFGKHEGDWEWAQVRLTSANVPMSVTLSQHGNAERCTWGPYIQVSATGHPVVYVAHESHANYFWPGVYLAPVGSDVAGDFGSAYYESPDVVDVTSALAPGWMTWDGHWGGSFGSFFGPTASPKSPGAQGEPWDDPFGWEANPEVPCRGPQSLRRSALADEADSQAESQLPLKTDAERHGAAQEGTAVGGKPALPRILSAKVVRGTAYGKALRVLYCFRTLPADPWRRPWRLHLSVDNLRDSLPPLSGAWKVTKRCARVTHPVGPIKPPYLLRYWVESRRGSRSKLATMRVS